MISPILPPVIMNAAITSVYIVIAVWIPVTVVPTSLATVAIDTFITDVSSAMRNCAEARVKSTTDAAPAALSALTVADGLDTGGQRSRQLQRRRRASHHGKRTRGCHGCDPRASHAMVVPRRSVDLTTCLARA